MNATFISILAGLGGMFGWGTSDFFANISSEKIGHFKTFLWSQIFGMLILGLLFFFVGHFEMLSFKSFSILFISAFFYAIGYLLFYKAFEIGTVSVVSSTINLNTVLAMIFALVFLGESLNGLQVLAVSIVIIGVVLVSINFGEFKNKKASLAKGVKETIFASFAFGIYWNLDKILSVQIGWLLTAFLTKIIAIFLLIIFSIFQKQDISFQKKLKPFVPTVALVGILEAVAVASVNWGLSVGQVVLVSPISSALTIVTISLAIIFLKERITKLQIAGIFLTIAGIVLTAF